MAATLGLLDADGADAFARLAVGRTSSTPRTPPGGGSNGPGIAHRGASGCGARGARAPRTPLADGVVPSPGARRCWPAHGASGPGPGPGAARRRPRGPIRSPALARTVVRFSPPPRPCPCPGPTPPGRCCRCSAPAARRVGVWEALDQAGVFSTLLPDWARAARPQRNAVHRFTVDRHLVEAAANAAAHTRRVSRPDLLLLGRCCTTSARAGRATTRGRGARIAERIAERWGLSPADRDIIVRLVEQHLVLGDTATRRDLDDPATVAAVADELGTAEALELMAALTRADALATGPAAWSEWKAGLVEDLVRRTTLSCMAHRRRRRARPPSRTGWSPPAGWPSSPSRTRRSPGP